MRRMSTDAGRSGDGAVGGTLHPGVQGHENYGKIRLTGQALPGRLCRSGPMQRSQTVMDTIVPSRSQMGSAQKIAFAPKRAGSKTSAAK